MERARPTAVPGVSVLSRPAASPSALARSARAGAFAAVGTWAIVVLPALVGWLAAPESTVNWFSAVSVGSAVWFLGHAQSIGTRAMTISLTPILLLLLFTYVAARFARRLIETERADASSAEWSRTTARAVVPGFAGGYLAVAVVVGLLTIGGPVGPGLAAVLGALVVPLAALAALLVRPDDEQAPAFVRSWFRRGASWLPTVWRLGWRGGGLLLLVGLGIALARVVFSWGDIARVQGAYGVNVAEALVVVAGQLLLMGNAATWALSFVAGPGFSIAAGAAISPAAAHPGLMPLVPVLGALPDEADYPAGLYAVVLVPLVVGLLIGRWVDAELEFFGNVRARFTATLAAAALAVAVVVVLTAVGNGGVGVERLTSIGAPVAALAGALLLEVATGAALWVCWRLWRERERDADPSGSRSTDDDAVNKTDADTADEDASVLETATER